MSKLGLADPLADVLVRLAELLRQDEPLRAGVNRLLEAWISGGREVPESASAATEMERVDAVAKAEAEAALAVEQPAVPTAPPVADRLDPAAALAKLDIGASAPRVPVDYQQFEEGSTGAGRALPDVTDEELGWVAQRSRLKAEACRWQNERRRLKAEGADVQLEISPRDHEIIERARALPGCFLWMCTPASPSPTGTLAWEIAGGAFEALAKAIEVTLKVRQSQSESDLKEALTLLAEAQSALRVAVGSVGYDKPDNEQFRVFHWLKRVTREENVFVERFMKIHDPGDPSEWADLVDRLEQLERRIDEVSQRRNEQTQLEHKLNYHLAKLEDVPPADGERHWRAVVDIVTRLVGEFGVAPSSQSLRAHLLPVVEQIPDEIALTPEFDRVVQSIDQYLADREEPEPEPQPETRAEVVEEARRLLAGKAVVLIGGVRRPESEKKLQQTLGLGRLEWVSTREHQSIAPFETAVSRPDVAVVLLAIRWASHSYEGVKAFCEKHGKLFVRLPAGYGVDQVAHQIVNQVGRRLADGN